MGNPDSSAARAVRFVAAMVVVSSFFIGATATGAYLALDSIVTSAVIRYANALEVALEPETVGFGLGSVQIRNAHYRLLRVPGVSGTIRAIDVTLSGITPRRVALDGVSVRATGDPFVLKDSILGYRDRMLRGVGSRAERALPKVEWQHLDFQLASENVLVPNVSASEVTIETNLGPARDETSIRTSATRVGSTDFGPLLVALRLQNDSFELGWGPTLLESKWRVAYRALATGEQLRFSCQPYAVTEAFRYLGIPAPEAFAKAKVSGYIDAYRDKPSGRTSGQLAWTLVGFTPPYPPELKGYRFADTTILRSEFTVDALFLGADLRPIELKTGDLSLVGHARVDRELTSARVRAELGAQLDCVTLAKGYATEAIGGDFGQWAANGAPKAVRGQVAVRVQIDAEAQHPERAKIVKRIGVGCGLRPMSLPELLSLGLPPIPDAKTLERLRKQVPVETVVANLPSLPQLVPTFDLPTLSSRPRLGVGSPGTRSTSKPPTTSGQSESGTPNHPR